MGKNVTIQELIQRNICVKKGDTVTVSTKKKKEADGKTTEKISLTAKQKTEE